ncbi:MAG TPA: hypothetical protein VK449_12515 [Anaerolineales bacterium]|nr:hypothetical protein [Anaerolineales bacterium]
MNTFDWNVLLTVALGLTLRFGIPLLLTVLAAWGLRRLDQRWQRQSEHLRPSPLAMGAAPAEVRCWEQTDCPPEKRDNCPAYARPSVACWQVFREATGYLSTSCLSCEVFLNAPARS